MRFQPGEDPSRGLLRDSKTDGFFAGLLWTLWIRERAARHGGAIIGV